MVEEKVDFLNVPESGITLLFKEWNPYRHVKGKLKVTLFRPEIGLQSHILNNTAYALGQLGLYQDALRAYQQAINIDPEFSYPYNNLGVALSELGRNEEAIRAYQEAINIDPKNTEAYNNLGSSLLDLGRNKEAIDSYKHAISIDPTYVSVYHNLGNALVALGRNTEAIEAYQKFVRLWSGDEYWLNRARRIIERLQNEQ